MPRTMLLKNVIAWCRDFKRLTSTKDAKQAVLNNYLFEKRFFVRINIKLSIEIFTVNILKKKLRKDF